MKELEKWLQTRYEALNKAFGDREFIFEDAKKVLEKDDKKGALVVLSELRKKGYLEAKMDKKDARKKIYKIKTESQVMPGPLNRDEIQRILKKAADLIRTRVDYKFILVLLFLKRISDKWQLEYEREYKNAVKDGFSDKEAEQEAMNGAYHDFILPDDYLGNNKNLWDNIRADVAHLPERLTDVMKKIGDLNPDVKDVVAETSFISFANNRENLEILRQLVELFSMHKLDDVDADILGDAYEWIMRYFAPTKAKEGEVYTPREIIDLLIHILEPKVKEEVYDPAMGSAGMLIASYKYGKEKFGDKVITMSFFGEEASGPTVALAQMNMYIHGIKQVKLVQGDTLLYPKFKDNKDNIKEFDVVIANPPWNQDGYAEDVLKKGELWQKRFEYGFVPNQSADWAWVQHMMASSKSKTGRVGVVLDSGALFRGGKEGQIRKKFVETGLVEAVILLPEKLFYNTGAPGIILILRKNKPKERADKILFINASEEFIKHKDVRKLNRLSDDNIAKIADTYSGFLRKKDFSRPVSRKEIAENDYSLNVTLYVSKEEEEEYIDVKAVWEEKKELDIKEKELSKKIERYLEEIK